MFSFSKPQIFHFVSVSVHSLQWSTGNWVWSWLKQKVMHWGSSGKILFSFNCKQSLYVLWELYQSSLLVKGCVKCYLGPWVVLESIPAPTKPVTMQWKSCFWSQWDCTTIHTGNIRVPDLGTHRSRAGWECIYPSCILWHLAQNKGGLVQWIDPRYWDSSSGRNQKMLSIHSSVEDSQGISGRKKTGSQPKASGKSVNAVNNIF